MQRGLRLNPFEKIGRCQEAAERRRKRKQEEGEKV